MEIIEADFFVDVLRIMPPKSMVEFWSNIEEIKTYLKPFSGEDWRPYKVEMSSDAVDKLDLQYIDVLVACLESVEIWSKGKKWFSGWDGMEIAEISKTAVLPEEFIAKYIDSGFCQISKDW